MGDKVDDLVKDVLPLLPMDDKEVGNVVVLVRGMGCLSPDKGGISNDAEVGMDAVILAVVGGCEEVVVLTLRLAHTSRSLLI